MVDVSTDLVSEVVTIHYLADYRCESVTVNNADTLQVGLHNDFIRIILF